MISSRVIFRVHTLNKVRLHFECTRNEPACIYNSVHRSEYNYSKHAWSYLIHEVTVYIIYSKYRLSLIWLSEIRSPQYTGRFIWLRLLAWSLLLCCILLKTQPTRYILLYWSLLAVLYIVLPYMLDHAGAVAILNVSFCWKRRLQFERGHCSRVAFISSS